MRVSTADQTLDAQSDALSAAGCFKVWTETASVATTTRPQLTDLLSRLRDGDTLVVCRLDRLGRSPPSVANRRRSRGPRSRIQIVDRSDRHHHLRRETHLLHLRRTGRIRTQPDPRANGLRSASPPPGRWPHRRPATEDDLHETRTGTTNAGERYTSHRYRRNHRRRQDHPLST